MYKLDDADNTDLYITTDIINNTINTIDLSKNTPDIKSISQIKSCLTHTIFSGLETMTNIYLNEIYPNKKRKKYKHIRDFIKNNNHDAECETIIFNKTGNKYGFNNMCYKNILKSMHSIDFMTNKRCIYKVNKFMRIKNTGKHFGSSRKNIFITMKYLLQQNIPIIGAFKVPLNIATSEKSGIIDIKAKPNFNYGVLFVGYNDKLNGEKDGYFKFLNSWGHRWGEKGFGYLPYKAIKKHKCLDMWVITDFSINYEGTIHNITYDINECNITPRE